MGFTWFAEKAIFVAGIEKNINWSYANNSDFTIEDLKTFRRKFIETGLNFTTKLWNVLNMIKRIAHWEGKRWKRYAHSHLINEASSLSYLQSS